MMWSKPGAICSSSGSDRCIMADADISINSIKLHFLSVHGNSLWGCQADNTYDGQTMHKMHAMQTLFKAGCLWVSTSTAQIQDTTCSEMVLDVCTESVAAMMTKTNANLHKQKNQDVSLKECAWTDHQQKWLHYGRLNRCAHAFVQGKYVYTWYIQ